MEAAAVRAKGLASHAAELAASASSAAPVPSLRSALQGSTVGVIAEIKRASPSRGSINPGLGAAEQAKKYELGGAAAISVLTEGSRFGGSDDDVAAARSATSIPILRKDFHVDPVQLLEARSLGSSAALVIARAVPPARLSELLQAGRDIGLEILLEIRNESELELALSLGAELIGVNNRDLETLTVDMATMDRLLPLIPRSCTAIAESGLVAREDVERAAAAGADAVLIGGSLSASHSPDKALRLLVGIRRVTDARQN